MMLSHITYPVALVAILAFVSPIANGSPVAGTPAGDPVVKRIPANTLPYEIPAISTDVIKRTTANTLPYEVPTISTGIVKRAPANTLPYEVSAVPTGNARLEVKVVLGHPCNTDKECAEQGFDGCGALHGAMCLNG